MKKYILILLALSAIQYSIFSQTITNILVSQRIDGSGNVDIYYNLQGTGNNYFVTMEVNFDNGNTYSAVSGSFLSGNIGWVTPNSNCHITWNGKGSHNNTYSTQTKIKLLASTTSPNYFTNEFYNLNNNQVPAGWVMTVVSPDVQLAEGKLIAYVVDSYASIERTGIIPPSTTQMIFEWDGSLIYTYWGMRTILQVYFGTDKYIIISSQLAACNNGVSNQINIDYYQGANRTIILQTAIPQIFNNYHFKVILTPSSINYKATNIASGAFFFDETINIPSNLNFTFNSVNSIKYCVNATTDNNCWLDNISINVIP